MEELGHGRSFPGIIIMHGKSRIRIAGLTLVLLIWDASSIIAQPSVIGGVRSPGYGGAVPGVPGGSGYGGIYPMIFPYQGGYNYGGYDPMVASVPSKAYLNLGNTSYTTESPLPIYGPRSPFAPLPPPLPLTALLKVQVPLDAEVWLEGMKMRSTGSMRHFRSPPLSPTLEYAYEVRARWLVDGKPIEDVRHVGIRAGAIVHVDFTHLDPLVPRPSAPPPPPKPAEPEDKSEPAK